MLVADVGELEGEWDRGVVDLLADWRARLIEEVEDAPLGEAVGRGQVVANVTERRSGQQEEAVGEGLGQDRGEVVVADGEFAVEVVVEGKVALAVVAHGAAASWIPRDDVGGGEAVHRSAV